MSKATLGLAIPALQAGTIFYSSESDLLSAAGTAGLSTSTIDFESVTTGGYDTSFGLTVNGITFVGPFLGGYSLNVGAALFTTGTGNTLWSGNEIDIALPPGTYAFGANVGASALAFPPPGGATSDISLQLSTGDESSTPVSTDNLFPFFGFVSTVPVSTIEIGGPTFLTLDNVVTGAEAVPEPSAVAPLFAAMLLGALVIRRRRAVSATETCSAVQPG